MSKTLVLYKGETWFVKVIGETWFVKVIGETCFYCDEYKRVNMVGFYSINRVRGIFEFISFI